MSRNRATLILLMLCGTIALAAAAPVPSRGGAASEVHTLEASAAVQYDPSPRNQMAELDSAIESAEQKREAEIVAYVAAVEQAEAERLAAEQAAAAEAARVEAARQEAARAEAASPPPPPPAPVARTAGACGGWADLIAAYFPGEEATACRVMMCESGGDPTVHNAGSSTASGLWQFLDGTWESTTGTPGPAANYSAETQTAAAAKLRQSSGWSQWSCY